MWMLSRQSIPTQRMQHFGARLRELGFAEDTSEAFRGRVKGGFFSRDLEDLVAVVDGRESLVAEVRSGSLELQDYIRSAIKRLLSSTKFLDALPGFLLPDADSHARVQTVRDRLNRLVAG